MSSSMLFLALLPGIIIIIYIFRKDRVEHEPRGLIIKLVILGAVSCIPAIFLEQWITSMSPGFDEGSWGYSLFMAFCVAGICEEVCKFVLLRIGSWRNPNYDYRFDGIVYAVCVAVGFALLENIGYVAVGGMEVALTRGVLAVPLHAFCGVFMGVNYGAAKRYSVMGHPAKSFSAQLAAIIIPVIIHGIYDTLAFMGQSWSTIALLVFVGIMYIAAVKNVNRYAKEDWRAGFYTSKLSDL